jgi:hypothetical protein
MDKPTNPVILSILSAENVSLFVSGTSNAFDLGEVSYFRSVHLSWDFGEAFCHSFLQGKEIQEL